MAITTDHNGAPGNWSWLLYGPKQLRFQQRAYPGPAREGKAIVKVIATGICGSDIHTWEDGGIGSRRVKEHPLVPGHEAAGVVVEVGPNVSKVKVGDRVAIQPLVSCGKCRFCATGLINLCADERYASAPRQDGKEGEHGFMCQYFSADEHMLVPVPEHVGWLEAGCIQPLAIAVQIARRARLTPHQKVVVFGCGPIGLMTQAVAKAYFASLVLAVEINPKRAEFARSYVADKVFQAEEHRPEEKPLLEWVTGLADRWLAEAGLQAPDAPGGLGGVDVVVDCSGAESAAQIGMYMLRKGGTYCQVGFGSTFVNFPLLRLPSNELNVVGLHRYGFGRFEEAVELLARRAVDLKPLVTKTFPLSEAEDAMLACKSGEEIKIVILNQGTLE